MVIDNTIVKLVIVARKAKIVIGSHEVGKLGDRSRARERELDYSRRKIYKYYIRIHIHIQYFGIWLYIPVERCCVDSEFPLGDENRCLRR